jgi:hypothetical protein
VAGLLALGELNPSPLGSALLDELRVDVDPWASGPTKWGLSAVTFDASAAGDGSERWIEEISLTTRPAGLDTRVLAVGRFAVDAFAMLSGAPAPDLSHLTVTTVRKMIGAYNDGTPIYGDEG